MPRDFSVAYTEVEVEELFTRLRKLPTYSKDGDYFLTDDIPAAFKEMGYERSPEQLEAYKVFLDKNHDGKWLFAEGFQSVLLMHDTAKLAKQRATFFDKDKNGVISEYEFDELLALMCAHDPKLKMITFQEFVKSADTNSDGKVSIDECAAWIQANTAKEETIKNE